jgi:PAS domain S-box-containing protein
VLRTGNLVFGESLRAPGVPVDGGGVGVARWRFLALPLAIWLLAAGLGVGGLGWQQHSGREGLAQRFQLRVKLMSDFVTSYVADLIEREQVQAAAFLTERTVDPRDFARSVAGFGYTAAVLLDDRGRVLQAAPADPALIGRDLTAHYAHLRNALEKGQSTVSPVVPSAVRGIPVVAFAVPFPTSQGRRVFSGAVDIRKSQLSSYLSTALSLRGARLQLVDASGAIVAANQPLDAAVPTLTTHNPALAEALGRHEHGRYEQDGNWWRYSSYAVPGTPWRLSATVEETVLFASVKDNEIAGRAAVSAAALVGLVVVGATTRARRSRRELQVSEERFRQVFDNSRIGMILTDPQGRITQANPAVCQLLGRSVPDLVGKHFNTVTHPDDIAVGKAEAAECRAGRSEGFTLQKRYVHAEGRTVEGSVTCAVLRDQAGRPRHFATQIVDVTERRALERARDRHEAELASRAEQLQRANTQMADFIAMLTHDVRQPLTNIVAAGEMLLEDWGSLEDQTRHHYVRRMTVSGHRAGHLVSEILTLAQLDAGALVARPTRLDVAHAVRDAVAAQGGAPDDAITAVAPGRTIGLADPTHLELILANLLGNATKYGAPPVTVTVDDDPQHVRIRVSDQGEGVPDAFVPHLFDRFTRAETGVATTKTGTGLGLYLVRQLADASGIQIDYQPNLPRGSTFTLTLDRPHP